MSHCRYRDCKEEVKKVGDVCPTHYQMLLQRVQRHRYLSDEDKHFLLKHIHGCFIGEVADYLGLKIDTIDHFLTLEFEGLTFGGPGQFLDQRKLIRALLHQEKLRQVEEEIARRETARKAKAEQERAKPQAAPVQVAPREQPLPPVAEIEEEPRGVKRADEELVATDIESLTGICRETIRRWMINGLIPCETRPWGSTGGIMRMVKLNELIAFFQTNFGNRRFCRYAGNFRRFLKDNDALPEQVATETPEPKKPTRWGGRAEDELTAWDVERLLEVNDGTIRRWMNKGLLPYKEIPLGDRGRVMKVVKMTELVDFVQSCFGNWQFARYGEKFSRFLREHASEGVVVS